MWNVLGSPLTGSSVHLLKNSLQMIITDTQNRFYLEINYKI